MEEEPAKGNLELAKNRQENRELQFFIIPMIILYLVAIDFEALEHSIPLWKNYLGFAFLPLMFVAILIFVRAHKRKDEFQQLLQLKAMAAGFIPMAFLAVTFAIFGSLELANRQGDGSVGWPEWFGEAVDVFVSFSGFLIYIVGMVTFGIARHLYEKRSER